MDLNSSPHTSPRRPRHHKRLSTLRLSTDTTATLPAYSAPPRPSPASQWPIHTDTPSDEPPDYPQSAEEADQEDDYTPLPPRTAVRKPRHRRSESLVNIPTATSVDDLLERSVVALELSTNALLQSMNTKSSISAIANDQMLERSLDRQAMILDMRIRGNRAAHEEWMDGLDDVMKRVDGLFPSVPNADLDGAVSRSLPSDSLPLPRPRKRKTPGVSADQPYFHLTTSEHDLRDAVTVRPPRALTQYVSVESSLGDTIEATADPESIFLPSTMGLRSRAQVRTFSPNGDSPKLRKAMSSPGPERPSYMGSQAYSMLSDLASRKPPSRSPSRTRTASPHRSPGRSEGRIKPGGRRHSAGSYDSSITLTGGLRRARSSSSRCSTTSTETPIPPPPVRAMTPPMEESTPSSSESEQNDRAFRAMQSLRKILDEAPDPKGKRPESPSAKPKPVFMPRTPSVAPSSGTSMATASVYRLFTKNSHHPSSSKPKQSSLKKPATPDTPGSRKSSAPSTPRQVSFAELPVDFPGRTSSWRDKDKGKRSKGKGKGKGSKEPEQEEHKWWKWLSGPNVLHPNAGAYEDRIEDKMMRGWARPGTTSESGADWMM